MKITRFATKFLFATLLLTVFFFSNSLFAQHTLTVEVSDIRSNKGTIMIALFKGALGFPKDDSKAIHKAKVTVKNNKAIITFTNLPSGDYAFALFHDENNNNEINKNMFGIPSEGYGFSTNFKPTISAPNFDQAHFKIEGNTVQKIKIIN